MKTYRRPPQVLRSIGRLCWLCLALWLTRPAVQADRPLDFKASDFAVPVWAESGSMMVVEAEDIPHSNRWELRKSAAADGSKPTGQGYLAWVGPEQGLGHESDDNQEHQGDHRDWLVIRTNLPKGGWYTFNLRINHAKFDGDNDVWMGQIATGTPIQRAGSNVPGEFHWLGWGVQIFAMRRGPDALYIAGRSRGFGIDRIAIYRLDAQDQALNPETPVSQLFRPNPFTGETIFPLANGWKWSSWGFFHDAAYPFVFHLDHEWLYMEGDNLAGFFFYRFRDGRWGWTGLTYFPFHYDYHLGEWVDPGQTGL